MESFWSPNALFDTPEPHPRHVRFEATRVRQVLAAFGLADEAPTLIADYKEKWDRGRLTFEAFHDRYPTFPVVLEAQSFYGSDPRFSEWARVAAWLTRFAETPVGGRYQVLLHRYERYCDPAKLVMAEPIPPVGRGLPVGMPFPWQRIRGGLIVHNGEPRTADGLLTTAVRDRSGSPVRVTVERFTPWLAGLARTGWTPHGRPLVTAADPPGRCGPHLRPAVVRACGGNPRDAVVLAWLLYVWAGRAAPGEATWLVYRDGGAVVEATRARVAAATGLSPQQVGDALASLTARGLIGCAAEPGRPMRVWVDVDEVNRAAG